MKQVKKLFPKKKLGRLVWIGGALIEVLGFALLFNSPKTIEFLSNNSFLVSVGIITVGLFVAVGAREIKK